jgi:hypothetical protein
MLKLTLLTVATFSIFSSVNDFHHALPTPVQFKENSVLTETKQVLTLLGRDVKFAEPLYLAAKAGNIDPVLFACLIETESEFKINVISKKNYKGLGQTPHAMMREGYLVVDLTLASCILREKLNSGYAKGDMTKAIQLYKGGTSNEALKYAKQVMTKYQKIKEQMRG